MKKMVHCVIFVSILGFSAVAEAREPARYRGAPHEPANTINARECQEIGGGMAHCPSGLVAERRAFLERKKAEEVIRGHGSPSSTASVERVDEREVAVANN